MWNHQPLQHPPREETRRLFVQTWTLSRQHYTVQSLYFNIQCMKRDCILFALHYFSFASICFCLSVVWKHPISLNLAHIRQCRLGKFSEMLVTRPFWWTLQMSPLARWGAGCLFFALAVHLAWTTAYTTLHRSSQGMFKKCPSMRKYPCHGTPLWRVFILHVFKKRNQRMWISNTPKVWCWGRLALWHVGCSRRGPHAS